MLSQVLFGEKYRIIDEAGHWVKIETLFDNYAGWIDKNHLQATVNNDEAISHVLKRSLLCFKNDRTRLVLEAGCEIHNPDFERKVFSAGDSTYTFNDSPSAVYLDVNESVADTAMKFVNSPYLWGGRIPSGIDCSGLTQLVYKLHGIKISRDSWKQANEGRTINFIEEARPGDLAFFDDESGRITHTGIIISNGLVIHASGRVRIDIVDHQGIYRKEIKGYTHKLRTIRRIID